MPLAAELPLNEMVLPPLDVYWVWHCHCLNHVLFSFPNLKVSTNRKSFLINSKSRLQLTLQYIYA